MPAEPAASPSPAARRPRTRRNVVLLALAVAVLVAAWSAYWWVLIGRVETTLRDALTRPLPDGTVVTCTPLVVGGYPFRVEARCGAVSAELPDGGRLAAGALTAVALAYDWRKAIFELAGPLSLATTDGPEAGATWSTARASVARDGTVLASADLVLDTPAVTMGGAEVVRATHAEAHLRQAPGDDGGTDVALSATGLTATTFPAPLDLALVASIGDGGAALRGRGPLFEGIGDAPLPVAVRTLSLASGSAKLAVAGNVIIDQEGRLDGTLDVTITDPAALAALIAQVLPSDSPLPGALAGAVTAFGRDDGKGGRTVPVTIRRGRANVGLIPLGRLPRLPVRAAYQ
jgi:hypothetical protein